MIRILQVLGTLNCGGAEAMIMNLYRNIDRTKIQFDFVVHTSGFNDFYAKEVLELGGRIYPFPRFKVYNYFTLAKLWDNFFNEHPEYKIMHSHVTSYASLYLPIARKHGLKTIVHSHSTSEDKGFSYFIKRLMSRSLKSQADFLFACSKESGKFLYGNKGIEQNNYRMLPNAVDTSGLLFNEDIRSKVRNDLCISDNRIVYGHVGRFHPAKNHLFLLEVFKGLLDRNPDALLLLVGDGALRPQIEAKISELKLENSVILLGTRSDVANLLQAMDVFLFPSQWEGLPVSVVEAQAAGLPCFVSDTVTQDVGISDLVSYLPINKGVNPWVENILKSSLARKNVIDDIKKAGFDVKYSAQELTNFYIEQHTMCERL